MVIIGRSAKDLGFTPPDKTPVRLVFLILTPSSQPLEQLRILSRIAALMNNDTLRRQLTKAKSAQQLLEIIRTSETLIVG
jgi:mannitol/fructose-specific phosphotransferase system IIA component (Ntr-type)